MNYLIITTCFDLCVPYSVYYNRQFFCDIFIIFWFLLLLFCALLLFVVGDFPVFNLLKPEFYI